MKVYVTTGRTESGDDICPIVWGHFPEREEVDAVLAKTYALDWEAGCLTSYGTEEAIFIP